MKHYVPYTYLIGWSEHDRWYYGVEYSSKRKTANPSNLFTCYFTSSRAVAEMIEKYSNPDVITIRRTFKTAEAARDWEETVLRRMKVVRAEKWLNKTDNRSIECDYGEEWRAKVRKPKAQYTVTDKVVKAREARAAKALGKKHPPRSAEARQRVSAARKGGSWYNDGTTEFYSLTPIEGLSTGRLIKLVACPHCKREFSPSNLSRYHGDKCKLKPIRESL